MDRPSPVRVFGLISILLIAACAGQTPAVAPVSAWDQMSAPARADRLQREAGVDFRFVAVPGAVLRFVEIDAGPTAPAGSMLFVHGLNGAMGDFGPLFLRFAAARTRRLIAVDLPGWGGSLSRDGDHRVSSYAAALAAFITRVRLPGVHLVCHSLGGQVCLALTLGHPDLVHSLTLISPAGVYRTATYLRGAVRRFGRVNIGRVPQTDPARSLVAALAEPGELVSRFVTRNRTALAMLSSFHENQRDGLPLLRVPTLVIWGADDPVLPMEDGFVIAASVPGAVLHVVEGAGHESQLTHAELAYDWIDDWIDGHPAAP
jgi:pyruvate dehydrogenase E2 component (dihydrolipoamide acetyltransferase)